jgi:hypothetical protein
MLLTTLRLWAAGFLIGQSPACQEGHKRRVAVRALLDRHIDSHLYLCQHGSDVRGRRESGLQREAGEDVRCLARQQLRHRLDPAVQERPYALTCAAAEPWGSPGRTARAD